MSRPPPFWCCVPTCSCSCRCRIQEEASLSECGWKASSWRSFSFGAWLKVLIWSDEGWYCTEIQPGQERHRALLRGGSESSDWANRRGRTVAGMIILTGRTSEAKAPCPFTWEHPIRRVTDGTCRNRGPHGSPSPEKGAPLSGGYVSLSVPQIQIPEEDDGACHGMERFPERRNRPPRS